MLARFVGEILLFASLGLEDIAAQAGKYCADDHRAVANYSNLDLADIPSRIPHNTTILDLSYNRLTSIRNNSFSDLDRLLTLILSSNRIADLESGIFIGLSTLCRLDLSDNPLDAKSFPRSVFKYIPDLKVLVLENVDGNYPDEAFTDLVNLRQMFVSPPNGLHLGPGFGSMRSLEEFHITGGSVGRLKNDTFMSLRNVSLKTLSCKSCGLMEIETGVFIPLTELQVLDLSGNELLGLSNGMRALYGLQHRNMTAILLQNINSINYFFEHSNFDLGETETEFLKNICVESLDLGNNYIASITDKSFSSPAFKTCFKRISFRNHRLFASTGGVIDLLRFRQLEYLDIRGLRGYDTSETAPGKASGQQYLQSSDFDVPFQSPPNISYFDISHSIYTTWGRGQFVNSFKLQFLDVSFNHLTRCNIFVRDTPSVTVLNISGIDCSSMSPSNFANFPRLEILEMAGVSLSKGILADTSGVLFQYQSQLTSLNVADNGLTDLHTNLFINLKLLRTLSLTNNKLIVLPRTLRHLDSLHQLNVSYNSLTHLGQSDRLWIEKMSAKTGLSVRLEGNPLSCICSTVDFVQWLIETHVNILNRDIITCTLTNGSMVEVIALQDNLHNFQVQCVSKLWLTFSVTTASLACLVLCLSVVGYRYRHNIKYWCLTKCRPGAEYKLLDKHYQFDAFVAYNHHDYRWVCFTLREFLEDRNPYRLCLHHRDFPAGESIQQNIVDAVNSSRKIILVVSKEFLSCDWSEFEIRMAGMRMVQEGRDNVVVVVLLEDIPVRQMPRSLINMWKNITFLLWTDDPCDTNLFWERLDEAMSKL